MTNLNLETQLQRNPDMISTDMDGDTVMMSIERGEYFGINSVGSRVWELLETPMSIADVSRRICDEYEVDETQCQQDMLAFTNELLAKNLVEVCSA